MANSLTLNGFLHREVGQVKQTDTNWLSAQGRGYQTPSTGFRYPSFGGKCRKARLGVWKATWNRLALNGFLDRENDQVKQAGAYWLSYHGNSAR